MKIFDIRKATLMTGREVLDLAMRPDEEWDLDTVVLEGRMDDAVFLAYDGIFFELDEFIRISPTDTATSRTSAGTLSARTRMIPAASRLQCTGPKRPCHPPRTAEDGQGGRSTMVLWPPASLSGRMDTVEDTRKENTMATREQVREMFKLLRKDGIVARMNFECCSGCAAYSLASRGETGQLAVYFTRQDDYHAFNDGGRKSGVMLRPLHIRYGVINGSAEDKCLEAVRAVLRAADQAGLVAVWNGDLRSTVRILP